MSAPKIKIAVIGTVGLPANYGGFETLADQLVKNLGGNYEFTVYCTSKRYPSKNRKKTFMGARLVYLPLNANGMQSVLYDALSILHAAFYADVLLVLGVAGAWMLPLVRLFTGKKIITSIDGIEWKREKWNPVAKMYLWLAEKIAVKYSHMDISDNESIQDYTARRYGTLSRVVEYGGNQAVPVKAAEEDYKHFPFLKYLYAIKVCRIEPENNVNLVLEAFKNIPNRELVIVGNWNSSTYGRGLKMEYATSTNIHLLDPIYDERIINMLRSNAYVYLHGHSAGGTNPSLVEAMNLGLPVIAYGVSYNRTTTENKALFFTSSEELNGLIRSVKSEDLQRISVEMKSIADRRYTWQVITTRYDALIKEVLQQALNKKLMGQLREKMPEKKLLSLGAAHLKYPQAFYEK